MVEEIYFRIKTGSETLYVPRRVVDDGYLAIQYGMLNLLLECKDARKTPPTRHATNAAKSPKMVTHEGDSDDPAVKDVHLGHAVLDAGLHLHAALWPQAARGATNSIGEFKRPFNDRRYDVVERKYNIRD